MKWQVVALIACSVTSAEAFAQASKTLAEAAARAYRDQHYEECAGLYSAAIEKGSQSGFDRYSAAACHALLGHSEEAFHLLEAATALGVTSVERLASDKAFAAMHTDPRWQASVDQMQRAKDAYLASVNTELATIKAEDQADRRQPTDWEKIAARDASRYRRVKEMIADQQLKVADDYYNAALVMQHGATAEDYELAHQLASRAAELKSDHLNARWLAAAAQDRWLWQLGKPQIYGTQFQKKRQADPWTMEPFDRNAVTDEGRAANGVRTLAESEQQLAKMNSDRPSDTDKR